MVESNKGFTYIELLVVLVIIGIILAAGNISYSEFNQRKLLEAETKQIVSYLDLARIKTSAQEKECASYDGTYTVALSGSTMSLTPGGCSAVTTYEIDSRMTFPQGNFSVQYLPQSTGITGDSCILVNFNALDKCGKITIEGSGLTEDTIVNSDSCTCP